MVFMNLSVMLGDSAEHVPFAQLSLSSDKAERIPQSEHVQRQVEGVIVQKHQPTYDNYLKHNNTALGGAVIHGLKVDHDIYMSAATLTITEDFHVMLTLTEVFEGLILEYLRVVHERNKQMELKRNTLPPFTVNDYREAMRLPREPRFDTPLAEELRSKMLESEVWKDSLSNRIA